MKIYIDENNYLKEWALAGDNGGFECPDPEDIEDFRENWQIYYYDGEKLIKNLELIPKFNLENQKEELRKNRNITCFPIINRGILWYNSLTEDQVSELNSWYQAWLDVTDTLEIPEAPIWLE